MKRRCKMFGHQGIILSIGAPMQCRRCGAVARHDGIMWRWVR